MNAKRRKEIETIISTLGNVRSKIASLLEEEQAAYDNLPESLQESDKGCDMESAVDALQAALDDAEDSFDDIIDGLNEASSY